MEKGVYSIFLDEERCTGCTNCIKRCPTEAIRVRDGKAKIFADRCIDCGECVRICPNHAPIPQSDAREKTGQFRHTIALPDPALFGQFKTKPSPRQILAAVAALGFDSVYEVAWAADAVSIAIREFIQEHKGEGPWISSSCPVAIRLVQVRFPSLTEQILPLLSPVEVAAKLAKEEFSRQLGIPPQEFGCFYLTPCPAQVTAIRSPYHLEHSYVDGALAISGLYCELREKISRTPEQNEPVKATAPGLTWGRVGGQTRAVQSENYLAIDGINNLLQVFEEIELGKFNTNIDFLECQCCQGGCVGGTFTVENPFVARVTLRRMASQLRPKLELEEEQEVLEYYRKGYYRAEKDVEPYSIMCLDKDIAKAIYMVEQSEKILKQLPGLDCGSCGCPTCRTLAEDIVCGIATETDCVFKLRERVQSLAEQMLALALKVPPVTVVQRQIMKTQREVLELAKRLPPVLAKPNQEKEGK
ncbi:MAG: [Fe-Fe] hydrogenase large subunit C-terminal domain-containing protein [Bacillota bacterium]|nr:[Fe-Fe] hydrogenase large subunit C-terminal domain-containing protein [Bacillota bacterium]